MVGDGHLQKIERIERQPIDLGSFHVRDRMDSGADRIGFAEQGLGLNEFAEGRRVTADQPGADKQEEEDAQGGQRVEGRVE